MIHLAFAILVLLTAPAYLVYFWETLGYSKWALITALLGDASNVCAIAVNDWQMPVIGYWLADDTIWKSGYNAKLPWLCDRFDISWLGVCSIGDFMIFAGTLVAITWIIQRAFRRGYGQAD